MPLDLPDGTGCFVDSNIFYYALVPSPPLSEPCIAFLDRAIAGHVSVYTSVSVLSDAIHKVMTAEAAKLAARDRTGIIGYLGKHPDIIHRLAGFPSAMARIKSLPLNILPADLALLESATRLSTQHALLTNDALIVALMQRHQLTNLVTNDDDFDRVPALTVWKPR